MAETLAHHLKRWTACQIQNVCMGTSDIDRHIFPDPSSSISDPSQIGQTGTTHSLLCLAVLEWSNGWRELMYSRS